MKKLVSLLLALLLACCCALGVSALEYPDSYTIRYETNGGYIDFMKQNSPGETYLMVSEVSSLYGDLVIPAELDGYPVRTVYFYPLLQDYAFEGCENLTSITFPGTMDSLLADWTGGTGGYPMGLKKIMVLDGAKSFGSAKFLHLEEAHLPASIRHIPKEALPWREEGFTIYAPTDSGGHRYALEHGVNFVAEGDVPVLFTDISGHWGEREILWNFRNRLLMGTSETAFSPEANLTRGMLAAVLCRLNNGSGNAEYFPEYQFDDVDPNAYYYEGACWLKYMKIADGEGNNRYRPNSNITREELVTMLLRYAKSYEEIRPSGNLDEFADAEKVHSWAKQAMSWAVGQGILKGDEKGRLNPQGLATRAEVAAMLYRFQQQRVYEEFY